MPRTSANKVISINELWQFFNRSATLFCIAGSDGFLKQVNPHVTELLGFTQEEMLTTPFIEFVHPDDRVATAKQSAAVRNGLRVGQVNNRILTAVGEHKWISWNATYIDSEDSVYLIGQDHTDTHAMEQKLEEEKNGRQKSILEASLNAQEKERAEIGKELHDNINQMLATVMLYHQMAISEKEHCDEMISRGSEIVKNAIAEIRSLSKSLVGPDMKLVSLTDSVKELIEPIQRGTHLKFTFRTSGKIDGIPSGIKLTLFRIVQEQLNNIIKHAEAKKVSIRIVRRGSNLLLSIVDNGKGFDKAKKRNGIGLNNMLSRIDLYNGTMEIDSAEGKGCALHISIPIPAES